MMMVDIWILAPTDLGENCRRDIVLELEDMGFDIEAKSP